MWNFINKRKKKGKVLMIVILYFLGIGIIIFFCYDINIFMDEI